MKTKSKTSLSLELEGKVFIVEKDDSGKVVSEEELDGETVLKCVISMLEQALDNEVVVKGLTEKKARTINSGKKKKT